MTNPYFYSILLFAFMAVLGAIDASLTNYQLIPFMNGLKWMRLHFITLGVMTQAIFLIAPIMAARRANLPRPKVRWDIWVLLNTGIVALVYGIPAINNNVILAGGTLVFIAVTLLALQLAGMNKQGDAQPAGTNAEPNELDSAESGRKFYITGLLYLLFGIIIGTGFWMGWPALMRMKVPVEVHIHANNWGFMSLAFAGMIIDYYGRFTGRRLAAGKGAINAIFWLMTVGALGLVLGPWFGKLYLTVPGLLMHLAGTLWLMWAMIKPLMGSGKWTPGAWHLILAYAWILAPVLTAPVVILGLPGFSGGIVEANAPQALIYGWVLQVAVAVIPFFTMRVFRPDEPARLGGSWWTVIGLNLGSILLWMGIFITPYFNVLTGSAYLVWAITAFIFAWDLLKIIRAGTDGDESAAIALG